MLTPEQETAFNTLDAWAKEWLGQSDKCINADLCCGKDSKELRWKIAKVYAFWSGLQTVRERMGNNDPNALESLYTRLQCLIDLKIAES